MSEATPTPHTTTLLDTTPFEEHLNKPAQGDGDPDVGWFFEGLKGNILKRSLRPRDREEDRYA